MSHEPELGQLVFGNPTGEYGTMEWVDALVDSLLNEIERVYGNEQQKNWERWEDPKLEGVEFRPYDWSDNPETICLPNLKFSHDPQEIRWYKHPGRGQSSSLEYTPEQWITWFNGALKIIRDNEDELY